MAQMNRINTDNAAKSYVILITCAISVLVYLPAENYKGQTFNETI